MNPEPEPIFSASQPRAPVLLAAAIILGFAVQQVTGVRIEPYVFTPADLHDGRWTVTLFSSLFLHGGWGHALMNAVFALAFGSPVARYLGRGPGAASAFLLFFLACGAAASLGFALLHQNEDVGLIGASGGLSGFAAVAARLIAGRGEMGRIISPAVIGMGAAWLIINLLIAITGLAPGAGGQPVGWEAHIAGFAAGLLFSAVLPYLRRRP